MRSNQFFVPLLILAVVVTSCEEKKVSTITYPSVYHKAGIEASGHLRVFSLSGEIKRSSIVDRFNGYDTSYFKNYAGFIRNDPNVADTISLLDSLHARVYHNGACKDCRLTIQNSLVVLVEADATSKCCFNGEVFTRSLPYHLVRRKPEVRSEFIFSSNGGNYNFGYKGRNQYILKESNGKLVVPLILFTLHSGKFDNGYVNGELQPDFYSNLAAGDTVSLMEFIIYFEK